MINKNKIINILKDAGFMINNKTEELHKLYDINNIDNVKDPLDTLYKACEIYQDLLESYVVTLGNIANCCGIDTSEFKTEYYKYEQTKSKYLQ